MIHEIQIPQLGESVSEGVIASWLVQDGELVEAGAAVCELETDKVSMQVTAPQAGRVKLLVAVGATVRVGQVIARIDTAAAGTAAGAAASAPQALAVKLPSSRATERPPAAPGVRAPAADGPALIPAAGMPQLAAKLAGATGADFPLSPAVRRLVTEERVDPVSIAPTGPGGRITKGDVLRHLEEQAQRLSAAPPAPPAAMPPAPQPAPFSAGPREPPGPAVAHAVSATAAPGAAAPKPETRHQMSTIRQRIAERLVLAQREAASLTTFNEVDMSAVLAMRERFREPFEKRYGVRLGMMSFFVKAVVDALAAVPAVNARIDGDEVVTHHYYDIGVAVATDRGLIVPVVRGCDRLGFAEIERAIADLAARARARAIGLDELTGGCFTISNGGVYGSLLSTPILNPPQSGILGLHAIKKRPVVVNDELAIRPMMYLAMSYDHRLVDGQQAVTFLRRVVECMENPERMLLQV